ncbi:MAG: hypothetical protein Q7T82_05075 [Armatimonadota bacterium]|nr:hypothetical protein [Armatimonadota bacterium]
MVRWSDDRRQTTEQTRWSEGQRVGWSEVGRGEAVVGSRWPDSDGRRRRAEDRRQTHARKVGWVVVGVFLRFLRYLL